MGLKKVHVVSNTHWDREHRHGFQETRFMLVETIYSRSLLFQLNSEQYMKLEELLV